MPITLSQADYWELIESSPEAAIAPSGDSICPFPARLGEGYYRSVPLSDGLDLEIVDYRLKDDVSVRCGDRSHPLEYAFEQIGTVGKSTQRYHVWGSGLAPEELWHTVGSARIVRVNVHIEPAVFRQWIGNTNALPAALKPLLRSPDQEYYQQSGVPSASMQTVLQQILHCPYQGFIRRLYLEGKLLEMMALILADMEEEVPLLAPVLKPEDVERINYAGEILRSQLTNPPSLLGLARQVQINDHKLKVGFRQVFGTTVFGYLHDYRMEKSRQLLESGSISVSGAAQSVGFANRSHFATAFRKKFGMNPSLYRKCKPSAFRVS